MKNIIYIILLICNISIAQNTQKEIHKTLNLWHKAASDANFEDYFNYMTTDAVFIGTDATENWQNKDFKTFAKPYFDAGKAWNFTPLERNIYIDSSQKIAWFDELLDTQMKVCRGSGVLKKIDNEWKIAHYVLSITIPNENVSQIVEIKQDVDDKLTKKLQENNN